MIQSSKDEKQLLWVQYKVLKPYRMIYMNASEEYIILLYIRTQFQVLIALYSKSQNLKGYENNCMTQVGYVVDSKIRFIRDW